MQDVGTVQLVPYVQVAACFELDYTITAGQLLYMVIDGEGRIFREADRPFDRANDIAGAVVEAHPGLVVEQAGALLARLLVIGHVGAQVVTQIVGIILNGLDGHEAVAPHAAHLGVVHPRGGAVEEEQAMEVPRTPALLLLDVDVAEGPIAPAAALRELAPVGGYPGVVAHVLGVGERHKAYIGGRVVVAVDNLLQVVERPLDRAHVIGLGTRLAVLVGPYLRRAADVVEIIVDTIYARLSRGCMLADRDVRGMTAVGKLDIASLELEGVIIGHGASSVVQLCTYNQVKEIKGCALSPVDSAWQDLGYMQERIRAGNERGGAAGQARRYTARRAGAPSRDVELTAGFRGDVSNRTSG